MCKWKMKASVFVLTAAMTAACGLPAMVFADDMTVAEGGNAGFTTVTEAAASGGETNESTAAAPDVTKPDGAKPDGECQETAGSENESKDSPNQGVDAKDGEKTEALPEGTEPSVDVPEITEPDVTKPEITEPDATEPEITEPDATEPEITEPEITEPAPAPEAALEEVPVADAVLILRHIITSGGRDYVDEAVVNGLKEGDVAQASDYARISFKGVEYIDTDEAATLAAGKNIMELHYILKEGYQIAEK